jgi:hypothetical protein
MINKIRGVSVAMNTATQPIPDYFSKYPLRVRDRTDDAVGIGNKICK